MGGTQLSLAAAYVPQQRSYIERLWGTLFGTARVLLATAGLSVRFHPWALTTACWIHNRLPSVRRDSKSPYERLTGRLPDLSRLHTFGCAVAVFKSSDERNKAKGIKKLTADHAEFGVYMGPCEASPAQVVYLPARNRMVTAAHCLFNEDSLPVRSPCVPLLVVCVRRRGVRIRQTPPPLVALPFECDLHSSCTCWLPRPH